MHWIKATCAKSHRTVYVNLALARTITGLHQGTIIQFDAGDGMTVKESAEHVLRLAEQMLVEAIPSVGERMVD